MRCVKEKESNFPLVVLTIISMAIFCISGYGENTGDFEVVYESENGEVRQEFEISLLQAVTFEFFGSPDLSGNYKVYITGDEKGCYSDPPGKNLPRIELIEHFDEESSLDYSGMNSFQCINDFDIEDRKRIKKLLEEFVLHKANLPQKAKIY